MIPCGNQSHHFHDPRIFLLSLLPLRLRQILVHAQKRKQHTDGLLAVPAIEFHLAETLKIRQKPFLTERRRRRLLWVQYRPCQNLPALFPDKINPHIFPRLVLIRRVLHHLLWTD